MLYQLLTLIAEAMIIFLLVLWSHSSRNRVGLAHFYAFLGGLAAITSWITAAGLSVDISGTTFLVGTTVFYTAMLLAIFVVYVFDGPRSTRVAVTTVVAIALITPLVAKVLEWQMPEQAALSYLPQSSLRTNLAFILTPLADLVFLAVAWEYWSRPRLNMHLWLRVFFTLLAVLWLDSVLFVSGVFLGEPGYFAQLKGSLLSRLLLCLSASPFFFAYLYLQSSGKRESGEGQPLLAIHHEMASMRHELSTAQQELEHHKEVGRQLEAQVYTDELTQIANRRFFDFTYDTEWKRSVRNHQPLAVIMCDVDYFKLYNDHYGHQAGDECLRRVAQAIQKALYRPADMVARYGGEEFIVLLPETELADALDIAERIRITVQELKIEHLKSAAYPYVTLSLGVACRQLGQQQEASALITQADKGLYKCKEAGRNRVWPHIRKVTKAFMRIV